MRSLVLKELDQFVKEEVETDAFNDHFQEWDDHSDDLLPVDFTMSKLCDYLIDIRDPETYPLLHTIAKHKTLPEYRMVERKLRLIEAKL